MALTCRHGPVPFILQDIGLQACHQLPHPELRLVGVSPINLSLVYGFLNFLYQTRLQVMR